MEDWEAEPAGKGGELSLCGTGSVPSLLGPHWLCRLSGHWETGLIQCKCKSDLTQTYLFEFRGLFFLFHILPAPKTGLRQWAVLSHPLRSTRQWSLVVTEDTGPRWGPQGLGAPLGMLIRLHPGGVSQAGLQQLSAQANVLLPHSTNGWLAGFRMQPMKVLNPQSCGLGWAAIELLCEHW